MIPTPSLLLGRPSLAASPHRSSILALAAFLIGATIGCGGAAQQETPHHAGGHHGEGYHAAGHHAAEAGAPKSVDEQLGEVERIHGGAGPWAVAGYRMGVFALAKLGAPRGSFDLEIIHQSPRQVQLSCIADGAAAATGASLGKLNLSLVDADEAHLLTTYRLVSTGASLSLRPSAAFVKRFRYLPREELRAAGRVVISLPDAEVFEVVANPESP